MAELNYDYIAKLVRKTQAGDSDAFAELYAATYKKQYYLRSTSPMIQSGPITQPIRILVRSEMNGIRKLLLI